MTKTSKLKDRARAHEQAESWQAAIDAYQSVLEQSEEGGEGDLPLYNRVGDLYLRLGQPHKAVEYYQEAADKYADIGLYNNAIALCNKALRYLPNHAVLYRMLGQFSATQGFQQDARRYFLEYAEREVKAGEIEEAFVALEEFADLSRDPEIRVMLADQLHGADHTDAAVEQLKKAYLLHKEAGREARADEVEARIRELDPSAELPEPGPIRPEAPAATGLPEPGSVEEPGEMPLETSASAAGLAAAEEAGADQEPDEPEDADAVPGLEERPTVEPSVEAETVSGLEVGFSEAEPPAEAADVGGGGLAGLETFGDEVVEDEVQGVAPVEGIEEPPAADLEEPAVAEEPEPAEDREAVVGEVEDLEDEEEAEPLPLLDMGAEAVEEAADGPDARTEEPADEGEPLPLLDTGAAEAEAPAAPDAELEDEAGREEAVLDTGAAEAEAPAAAEAELEDEARMDEAVLDTGAVEAEEPAAAEDVVEEEAEVAAGADEAVSDEGPELMDLEGMDFGLPDDAEVRAPAGMAAGAAAEEVEDDLDPDAILDRSKELVGRGLIHAALDELSIFAAHPVSAEVYRQALVVVNEMVKREPDDVAAYQRRVEYAGRIGEVGLLVEAYSDLADCLSRSGAETKAVAVYQRVLDLDPEHYAARRAVEEKKGAAAERDDEEFVDLEAILQESATTAGAAEGAVGGGDEEFTALFSQFKARVTEDLSGEESGSHYDLGLAFKEMGLIDEAISEFQRALRGGEERLKVYEELGQCFIMKEQYNVAVKILGRALQLPSEEESDLLGVYYHLGQCHEELGQRAEAKSAYQRIMELDPAFRDVPERAARL